MHGSWTCCAPCTSCNAPRLVYSSRGAMRAWLWNGEKPRMSRPGVGIWGVPAGVLSLSRKPLLLLAAHVPTRVSLLHTCLLMDTSCSRLSPSPGCARLSALCSVSQEVTICVRFIWTFCLFSIYMLKTFFFLFFFVVESAFSSGEIGDRFHMLNQTGNSLRHVLFRGSQKHTLRQ